MFSKIQNPLSIAPPAPLVIPKSHRLMNTYGQITPKAFRIDHRHHLNLAFDRQSQLDHLMSPEKLAEDVAKQQVISIKNLSHLEKILEAAGGRLVILFLFSASCGVCKMAKKSFGELCLDNNRQLARTLFLEHDIYDEFDLPTDLVRYYGVKSVPKILFFVDGAFIKQLSLADTRSAMRHVDVSGGSRRLRSMLFELLIKNAPGSRR